MLAGSWLAVVASASRPSLLLYPSQPQPEPCGSAGSETPALRTGTGPQVLDPQCCAGWPL